MASPSTSTLPATPQRRLSSRRGSISAFDPFSKHAEINQKPERSSFSTLTIVRVPPQQPEQFSLHDPPPAGQRRPHPQHHNFHHNHRRTGSGGNGGSPGAGGTRLSFAFSSFAPPGKAATPASSGPDRSSSPTRSPSSSPRLRPSSPRSLSHGHGSGSAKPRLTPDQLYDVAHRATNPSLFPSNSEKGRGGAHDQSQPQPATFTPLPPAVYLPFVDRPGEVTALISSPPTKKLFALLSQTFPKHSQQPTSSPLPPSPTFSAPIAASGELSPTVSLRALPREAASVDITKIPSDPAKWSYTQLVAFMTQTTRTSVPDALWVALLRKCILGRSELIWERVKGALGVPPELDIDLDIEFDGGAGDVFDSSSESDAEEPVDSGASSSSGPNTDDMEDAGMKAKGHWAGWDATMDSPEFEKRPSQVMTVHHGEVRSDEFKARIDAALNESIIDSASISNRATANLAERSDSNQSGQTTLSPTPRMSSPPGQKPQLPPIVAQHVQDSGAHETPTESGATIPTIVQELPTPAASQDQFGVATPIPIPGADLDVPKFANPRKKKHSKSSGSLSNSLNSSWFGGSISLSSPVSGPEDTVWPSSTSADFGASPCDFGLSPFPGDFEAGGSPYISPTEGGELLSIEPLLSPSQSTQLTSPGLHPPPLSLPASLTFGTDDGSPADGGAGHGLGDIIEGEEEEEEEDKNDADDKKPEPPNADSAKSAGKESTVAIDPSQIQGLRISLSSQPSSPAMSPGISPNVSRVFWAGNNSNSNSEAGSPTVPNRPISWGSGAASRPSSRRSSFGYSPGLTRTGSTGSLTGMAMQLSGSYSEDEGSGKGGYRYDPVGDRVPGNPLFPSNFARLATGPTLVANNPSLRAQGLPPQPRYSHQQKSSSGLWNLRGGRFDRRSSFGASSVASDYAVTLASESVASGGGKVRTSDAH